MTTTAAHIAAAQAVLRVIGPIPATNDAIDALENLISTLYAAFQNAVSPLVTTSYDTLTDGERETLARLKGLLIKRNYTEYNLS